MAVVNDKNKYIKPRGSYRLDEAKGVSGDFATVMAIKTEFSAIISAGRTMGHTRTHTRPIGWLPRNNQFSETRGRHMTLQLDGAQKPVINYQGTVLDSLATNVVDRAMLHADRGNSDRGAREKKDSPRGDAVKQESLGILVAPSKDEQNCLTRFP